MNRPLKIRDLENISLEANDDNSDMHPQLVAQFTCQYEAKSTSDCMELKSSYFHIPHACCSVVRMINVTHAAIEGISVTVRTPHVSGVILQQCSHLRIHIQSITYISIQEPVIKNKPTTLNGRGILAYESCDIEMESLEASYFSVGVMLYKSRKTSMMGVSAAHNGNGGIRLINSTDTVMLNVSAVHNGFVGILLEKSTNTSMMNVSAAHNVNNGIMCLATNTSMLHNVSAVHNVVSGIVIAFSTDTSMMNVFVEYNGHHGIHMQSCNNTSMMNLFNQNNGIIMFKCINTSLYYSYTYHNGEVIYISHCTITHILYHNTGNTMYIISSTDTHIMNSVLNEHSHIEMRNTATTYITNTTSLITAYNTTNIVLNGTLFSNMQQYFRAKQSTSSHFSLYGSTLNITDCTFTRNTISSIKSISSKVTMSGKVLFHNNTAFLGSVLISAKKSVLITTDYSNIDFQNNYAIKYGGVFYITTEESYETSMSLQDIVRINIRGEYDNVNLGGGSLFTSRTECFVHVEGSRSHSRLTFINNTAGKGGDVLYGGLVALGYDGDWNCLLSFKNISNMSQQSGLSLISSAPTQVCLCNETGQPDCLTVADPRTRVMYPGQTITIPAVIVAQPRALYLPSSSTIQTQYTWSRNKTI